jgi:group II intron reverse transcriptase/maturase
MNERGKSDSLVVPRKSANEAGQPAEESMEGRGLAEGNPNEGDGLRTLGRESTTSALGRVREAARKDRKQRFTALLHHVYDVDRLQRAFEATRPDAAAGIDGETCESYAENLAGNLQELSDRLKRGAFRAQPVRRAYIPKADGRLRPIGVPTLEDKIVQRAVVEVLNAIYEVDFLGFSYGFRPGRSQHRALDAVSVGLTRKRVNWVIDADIRGFFDALDHEWLIRFVEHRIADKRVVRLIQKWLRAGVLEVGKTICSEVGTVQGGSISPLLANIYLHYVFDLWLNQWRKKEARGDVIVVRYADDFVIGVEHQDEAERLLEAIRERFARFALQLHPDKTRLIEFGRYAARDHSDRGDGKPPTFNFLGFTHICGKTRNGGFKVVRQTIRQRMQAKLKEISEVLRERRHRAVPDVGKWLGAVYRGHLNYFGVPGNQSATFVFRGELIRRWWQALRRRSQTGQVTWERMARLASKWIPKPRTCHPYPGQRLVV